MLKRLTILSTLLIMLTTSAKSQATPFNSYITRNGDKLYEGNKVFRFIGVNAPSINAHYDGYRDTNPESGYAYDPTELGYEMESYFQDMSQMGVTVFRTWGISVSDGSNDYEAFITGRHQYNEAAFRRIDKMLQLCNRYNMRVILCLVKENKYWGGTSAFSDLYGGGNYYTAAAVKDGFKHLLNYMANRINYYTGSSYRDDKAILAWEFGNEVPNDKVAWIDEMSTYLKRIDSNHLIVDPRRANGVEQMSTIVDDVMKQCKNIDFVKTRQYPNYRGTVNELWAICQGRIPLIIDEFQEMDEFPDILDRVQSTGTSGALLWSLMKHQLKGGLGGHALFHSYSWGGSRWPGFNSGAYFNEEKNLHLIRVHSFRIRGLKVPRLPAPTRKPFLFENFGRNAAALKWRLSPGARYYIVERSTSRQGPWTNISGDIDISFDLFFYPMFTDSSATIGSTFYYRVRGKNASGITPPSNVVGPVVIKQRMVMDNLADFSRVYAKSPNLEISSETWPRLRQTEEDFAQVVRAPGTAEGEIIYKAHQIKSIEVFVFNNKPDSLMIEYSSDGNSWKGTSQTIRRTVRESYSSMYSGDKNNPIAKYSYALEAFPPQTKYVKIKTGNRGALDSYPWIGRVHLGFTGTILSSD